MDSLDDLPDRTLVRIRRERPETPLLRLVAESDATLVRATGTDDGWTVTLRFPDAEAPAAFVEACRTHDVELRFRRLVDAAVHDDDGYGLSPKQRETLVVAFEAGYFDVPRGTTVADLADRLGVSVQAVSERLRRGLAAVLATTLGEDGSGGATDSAGRVADGSGGASGPGESPDGTGGQE